MELLQSMDLQIPIEVRPLFVREARTSSAGSAAHFEAGDGELRITAGSSVSFDTYFNAFFENCWFGFTGLKTVVVRLTVAGNATVRLRRQTPQFDMYELGAKRVDSQTPQVVEFEIRDDAEFRAEAGRLWLEVDAHEDVTVTGGGWYTPDPPRRQVSLGVVFCTFNRQPYLQALLGEISNHAPALDAVGRVLIINQGDQFSASEILGDTGTALKPKLTIIEQDNLGGCGGFTRGMFEVHNDPDLTHVAVLDDDSRLHADSVLRCVAFLKYCADDVAVGGHMLNLHRPMFLGEAGARLNESSLQPEPVNGGRFLGDQKGMESLLRVGPVDYNGWWFFAFSTAVLDDIGYPMPCFIRGDDIEFGMRLKLRGYRTVAVPGIAAWHEPFYLKLGGWQLFFEVRNRLMMASLHPDTDWAGVLDEISRVFARDISMSRYHSAKLTIAAIETYLAGPHVAFETDDSGLQLARSIVAEFGPERVDYPGHVPSRGEAVQERDAARQRLLKAVEAAERRFNKVALPVSAARRIATGRKAKKEPVYRAVDLVPFRVAGHASYVVVEEHGNIAWRFRHDVAVERALWRQFMALRRQLVRDSGCSQLQSDTDDWRSYWRGRFRPAAG